MNRARAVYRKLGPGIVQHMFKHVNRLTAPTIDAFKFSEQLTRIDRRALIKANR